MTDEQLKKIASFRSSKRFPAVVWRSKTTGAVLARSSQPNVGLLAWRLNEDELLIRAIADCCTITNNNNNNNNNKRLDQIDSNSLIQNSTTSLVSSNCMTLTNDSLKSSSSTTTTASGASSPITSQISEQSSVLLIIDARFRSVALANRVKGGGYEYSEYYTNCEIQFMNLENIHVIRSSFQALRLLCQTVTDNKL
jgi:myotubularin-related protein 3/4